jgi:hypothetical protein
MKISPSRLNTILMFKLPAAYFTGVRVIYLDSERCVATVRYRWINQNPFKSMYWAVQGMAAELATGALIMSKIKQGKLDMSMLLVGNKATFFKRSRGRIKFTCNEGSLVDQAIANAMKTGEGETIKMNAVGMEGEGIEVSNFTFEWAIKVRG